MKLSFNSLFLFSVAIISFLLSFFIAPFHTDGDQVHYTQAYYQISDLEFLEGLFVYRSLIYSFEPIHFLTIWVFSNLGFEKIYVMAGLNALLSVLFCKFILSKTKNYFLVSIIFFSNYYIYTLFFTLEKLKISVIFLLLLIIYRKWLFGLLSAFSHLQIIVILFAYHFSKILSSFSLEKFLKKYLRNSLVNFFIFSIFVILAILLFDQYIISKLGFYIDNNDESRGFYSLMPVIIFYSVTFLCAQNNKFQISLFFLIIASIVLIIGGSRINMYAYFGFLYFSNYRVVPFLKRLIFQSSLFCFVLYYGYKSYSYLDMIITYGG